MGKTFKVTDQSTICSTKCLGIQKITNLNAIHWRDLGVIACQITSNSIVWSKACSTKKSKLRLWLALLEEISPLTDGFPYKKLATRKLFLCKTAQQTIYAVCDVMGVYHHVNVHMFIMNNPLGYIRNTWSSHDLCLDHATVMNDKQWSVFPTEYKLHMHKCVKACTTKTIIYFYYFQLYDFNN